jgi:hypothetical protein
MTKQNRPRLPKSNTSCTSAQPSPDMPELFGLDTDDDDVIVVRLGRRGGMSVSVSTLDPVRLKKELPGIHGRLGDLHEIPHAVWLCLHSPSQQAPNAHPDERV